MKKRVFGFVMALAMLATFAVPVLAAGVSQTVPGEGFIGWGEVTYDKSRPPKIDPVWDDDTEVTGTGIPGSDIRVEWPGGSPDSTTTVEADGTWKVDVPATEDLQEFDVIYAYQTEEDLPESDPASVVVNSGEGGGGIDPPPVIEPVDPANYLNMTIPTDGFLWYVNQDTMPNVKSFDYSITNNGLDVENVDTGVIENYGAEVEITLKSFTEDTNMVINGLTLNLTGDLAIPGDPNLNNGFTAGHTYGTKLNRGETWTFSFGGAFANELPIVSLKPQYTMVLHFTVTGTDYQP